VSFALIVLTSSRWPNREIDAGRAVQDMKPAAWDRGVASGLTITLAETGVRVGFNISMEFSISAVVGFGLPGRRVLGKKRREPLSELVSPHRYENPFVRARRPVTQR
jgi:hypothetical protein